MKADKVTRRGQGAPGVFYIRQTAENEEPGEIAPAGGEWFGLAFANAPIGMAIVGSDSRLRRVNRALCEMLGYSQRALLKQSLLDLTHPDDRERDKALAGQLFRGEIPSYRLEKRVNTKGGRLVWLDTTVLLVRDTQNAPLHGLVMIEDSTERKRALEALCASEERYRSFIVNSSEGIWRFESAQPVDISLPAEEQFRLFYEHGYLAECNDAMARMYGYERADELVGADFQLLRTAVSPTIRANARAFIDNGYRLLNAEAVGFDAEGRKRFFTSNFIGVVVNGYLLRIWATQRDETQRREIEEQIESSRRQMRSLVAHLQSLSEKERAEIAREMHDVLGQGLTRLKMDVSWLGKRLPDAEGEGAEIALRLKEMSHLLDETLTSVKNLSAELRPGVLDKFGLAAAVEWQCQEFARRTGLSCESHLPKDEAALNAAHSTALFRILQEALTNVARHAGAKSVHVGLHVAHRLSTLIVRDDGRGITEEELAAPTSLGLLGMRERVETLGGSLEVGKGPTGGTVVKAQIPFDSDENHCCESAP
jgi:PAS domain S-box-containing protein